MKAIVEEKDDVVVADKLMANKLIELKAKTDQQLDEIKLLKDKIQPNLLVAPIKTKNGVVSFVRGGSSLLLNKDKIRLVLIENLHLSPENADKLISAGSVESIIASYVKVTPV